MSSRLTARDIQKQLHQIDFDGVPLWPDHLIGEAFLRIRDEQMKKILPAKLE
ncbi:hypothetical protein [Bdellovibrio sp. HCB274]|uniref:hypothetical protein n=1 Tax=Bdellovibrio sp. HCB274 TaxID=3394361 RepID=UPI0039B6128D